VLSPALVRVLAVKLAPLRSEVLASDIDDDVLEFASSGWNLARTRAELARRSRSSDCFASPRRRVKLC